METENQTKDDVVVLEGGVEMTKHKFQWKINNFEIVLQHEDLLQQQKQEFETTDCRGVKSLWKAELVFGRDRDRVGNENEKKKSSSFFGFGGGRKKSKSVPVQGGRSHLRLIHGIVETVGGPSYLNVHAYCSIEGNDKDGKPRELFKGYPGANCKYIAGAMKCWEIRSITKDTPISSLPLVNGSLVIDIELRIFGDGKSTPYCNGIGPDTREIENVNNLETSHKDRLYRLICRLENDPENSDIKIISSDGQQFYAYRWILSGSSDVFEAMLRLNSRETDTGEFVMEDLSGKAVRVLLHFIYTGNLAQDWSQEDTIEEIIYAADKYQIIGLKLRLDMKLDTACSLENAGHLLSLAKKIGLEQQEAVSEITKL